MPGFFEFNVFGFTLSLNVFSPSLVVMPLLYTNAGAYPFIESWFTDASASTSCWTDRATP